MKTKTILITAGIAITGLAILGYKKVTELQATFDKMTLYPVGVRNVKLGWLQTRLDIDVAFKNPTNMDFAVNGVVATLRRIYVNYKGKVLGVAEVNIDSITIPAYQTLVLKNLTVTVSNTDLLESAISLTEISLSDLQISAVVDVMGNEFILTQ